MFFFHSFYIFKKGMQKYKKFFKILRCVKYNNKIGTKADGDVVLQV